MISSINGVVNATAHQAVSIDLGPVTCTLAVPDSSCYSVGSHAVVHTHMHWNSEYGPTFYGFQTALDKAVFILIISCSGIGPKIALAALASLGAQNFLESIQLGDTRTLSSVSGIGTKKAEQIIMQLKNKISDLIASGQITHGSAKIEQWHTINLALESLHYSRPEINRAMDHLKSISQGGEHSFDQLMRKALALLSK
jgi:holliday junction DNA helicase RuvA